MVVTVTMQERDVLFCLKKAIQEHNRLVRLPLRRGERMSERAMEVADYKRLIENLRAAHTESLSR